MSTKTRNLSNIDGANVGNPTMDSFDANAVRAYANDAAFEVDNPSPVAGMLYWNTTELCLREYNGTAWQYDKTIYGTQNDSTTTGSNQDITPGVNQMIRFTHGSLTSIRSISPAVQKQVDFINGQASQNITIKDEDLTATAANRIVTGISSDVTLVPGQACRLVYDSIGTRWRISGALQGAGSGLTDWASLTNNLAISASVAANALTIALKTKSGANPSVGSPVLVGFRNSTLTDGTYNVRTVNSALSMVVSSGSTLGTSNATPAALWVYALDNAGTVELAISSTLYDTSTTLSTTAEGGAGAADSSSVIYSTTARSNVPMRVIAKIVSTQATAGTWATAPSLVTVTDISIGAGFVASSTAVPTGQIGELRTADSGAAVTYSAASTYENVTQVALSAGIWKVRGTVVQSFNNSTGPTNLQAALSGFSGSTTTDHATAVNQIVGIPTTTNTSDQTVEVSDLYVRSDGTNLYIGTFTISSTQILYLKSRISYTGTAPTRKGYIQAVRELQ